MSNKNNLGRLQRVELRDVWPDEARDFTPWLAREENLAVLSETLGIDLELKAIEESVGPFRADILCSDNSEETSLVLVENQLERTDHKHLGQLMTYAAGLHTVTIVWIAEKFTEDHRAALDWLNEITNTKFRFFGLEIELWRIGNSLAAPKFNIVSKPNDWSRSFAKSAQENWTDSAKLYYEFWQVFCEYIQKQDSSGNPRTPPPKQRMFFSVGRKGAGRYGLLKLRENKIGVRLRTWYENKEPFFDALYQQKQEIDSELGFNPVWDRRDGKIDAYVSYLRDADLNDRAQWENYFEWLWEHLEKLDRVFRPRLQNLNIEEWDEASAEE